MNNPAANQWMSQGIGINANSTDSGNGNRSGNTTGGRTDGMDTAGQREATMRHMNASSMMNMNNMNTLVNLNGNMNAYATTSNANIFCNSMASYPLQLQGFQGGQTNMMISGFIPSNNNVADAAASSMPINRSMDAGVFPLHNAVTVFKVKTGESMAPFLSGGPHQPPPQHQHGAHPMPSFNIGHSGGNGNQGVARSSSEPVLNHKADDYEPLGLSDAGQSHSQQCGLRRGSFDNQNNNLLGGMNYMMGNFSTCGGGSAGNNRRRSEPPLSMLSEMFDESTAVGENSNTGGGNNINTSTGLGSSNMSRSADGWSSPPIQETSLGTRRSNSVPLVSESMFDLYHLEPEQVFDDKTGGSSNKQLQGKDHSSTPRVIPRKDDNNGSTGSGKVKRSRSVDPMEMFRRVHDEGNHHYPIAHDLPNDGSYRDTDKGASSEEQQRLESMGIYSREKPKRRRSLPTLTQDDVSEDTSKQQGWEESHNNNPSSSSFAQVEPTATQSPQENNNMNLIEMLLGIENRTNCVPTGSNDSIGGTSQSSHRMKSVSATAPHRQQLPSHNQQLPLNIGSMPHGKLMRQLMPTATAPQSQQQLPSNSGLLAATSEPQQQPPSNSAYNMNSSNRLANQILFNGQQVGSSLAAPNDKSQAPPPLSIDNSQDLTLVLSAVKETQTNLRTLQPLVMQLGDPIAMEDLATAFKITASSSQFVLVSDLPSAYSTLNDAWAKIKKLEDRLAVQGSQQQQQQQQFLNMGNYSAFQDSSMMKQGMMFPQAALRNQVRKAAESSNGASMSNNLLVMGKSNPTHNPSVISSNNTRIPARVEKKKKSETKSGFDRQLAGPITPISGRNVVTDIQKLKAPPSIPRSKSKASKKKGSPASSPEEKAVELMALQPQNKNDPEIIMSRLKGLMDRTQLSQKQLQKWDKKNGLPKSHSQTMVNSSRSRKQLQKGVILKKWNGDPLISPADAERKTSQEKDCLSQDEPKKINSTKDEQEEQKNEKKRTIIVHDPESSVVTAPSGTTKGNEMLDYKQVDNPNAEDRSEIRSLPT